jgi:polar amino acid transport system substrate-binding protein
MPRFPIKVLILCIIAVIGVAGLYSTYLFLNNNDAKSDLTDYEVTYRVGLDDADFPPFIVFGEGGEPTGFDVDLIHWIGNEMEFNVEFVPIPWDDLFTALDKKEIDMIMGGISITPGRMENYLFSDPYLSTSQSIAMGEQSTMFMDDFYAGRGVVGVEGGTTSDDLATEILIDSGILPEENLKRYGQIETGAQDLANGDIQYLLSDWPVMVQLTQSNPIYIIGDLDTGEKYGIVLHKSNINFQQVINEGLERLTALYDWNEMKHRYLLDY